MSKKTSRTGSKSSPEVTSSKTTKTNSKVRKSAPRKSAKRSTLSKQQSKAAIDPARRLQMIEETAYFLAEARGFSGGSAMEDWLIAESQVDQQLSRQGI